jgi:two-component system, OmpR family, sensor histidine kinase KdpD
MATWRSLALATAACGVTTFIALQLFSFFDAPNLVALFMFTVVVVSLRLGRIAAIWSAVLSVTCFDFFFIPPRLSFAVTDVQYLFTFALFLVMALITNGLGSRLMAEARVARAGEQREAAAARVAHDLSGAIKIEQIVAICTDTFASLFDAKVALILPGSDDQLISAAADGFADLTAARWAFDHVQSAGLGTPTLGSADTLYLPLKAPIRCRGILAIRPKDRRALERPDDKRLLEACGSSIALALERIHFVDVTQDIFVRMEGERLRNALLSAISHDLRTPLTAIRGLAETLEGATGIAASDDREIASAIRCQAEELHRLFTSLLDLARMQSDGVKLDKQWHSLDEIVGSALARFGPAFSDRDLRIEIPTNLPLVEVDALVFERVLVNLLDNALKYTAPEVKIVIGAKTDGQWMYCFIEDHGHGLPPGDPDKLFEPFVRGQIESAISGVGLGLALSKNIIAAHGGTLRAEAVEPSGARFEIRVPLGTVPELETEDNV